MAKSLCSRSQYVLRIERERHFWDTRADWTQQHLGENVVRCIAMDGKSRRAGIVDNTIRAFVF